MSANICLAVLAHQGARETIAEFFPRWKALGIPIIGFLPDLDEWPGDLPHQVINCGVSSHRGEAVFRRFISTLDQLIWSTFDAFCIIEYDCVNLADRLPVWNSLYVGCGLAQMTNPAAEPEMQGKFFSFSPWIMTRPMAAALREACHMQLRYKWDEAFVDGLLDRWLFTAMKHARIPFGPLPGCFPWTNGDAATIPIIEKNKDNWVHGFKRKEQFKHLWPNS